MNELIKIKPREISGATVQTCNARDLWEFIESKQQFSDWIKGRIEKYGLAEGEDFTIHKFMNGRSVVIDYHLTIETGKELAMVENNEKGRQVRRYFIECERKAKTIDPAQVLNDPAAMRGLLLGYTEKVLTLEHKVEELTSKAVTLDLISSGPDTLTMTQVSKILGVKLKTLIERMNAELWIYRQNGSWVAYHRHIQSGNLVYKEAAFVDSESGMAKIKPYCHVTPKGLVKLAMLFGVNLDSADKGSFKA